MDQLLISRLAAESNPEKNCSFIVVYDHTLHAYSMPISVTIAHLFDVGHEAKECWLIDGWVWSCSCLLRKNNGSVAIQEGWTQFINNNNSLHTGDVIRFKFDGGRGIEVSIFSGRTTVAKRPGGRAINGDAYASSGSSGDDDEDSLWQEMQLAMMIGKSFVQRPCQY